jgi:hypothetical protein
MATLQSFTKSIRSAIGDSLATPKRDAAKPAGVERWFKYYAGFSPSFARAVLSSAQLTSTSIVLDPWNGSGTTTHAAAALGFHAVGVDISPVANVVASAKLANSGDLAHSDGLASQIVSNARRKKPSEGDVETHPLRRWLHAKDVSMFLALYRSALDLLARSPRADPINPLVVPPPPLAAFFILCLFRAARIHAGVVLSTNPAWVRPAARRSRVRCSPRGRYLSIAGTFRDTVKSLTAPFRDASPSTEPGHANVLAGDARNLPLADESVDLVVTSPPYCTRLDYPVSASFELAALGLDADQGLRRLRSSSMGTPLVRKGPSTMPEWPGRLQRLLAEIGSHPSKNSATYYLPTYEQYFSDAHASLSELRRVLRHGGKAMMVLQTSFYKEIPIPLPDLYIDIAGPLGFRGATVVRFPVKKFLTQINPTSQRHLADRQYVESVIALEAA